MWEEKEVNKESPNEQESWQKSLLLYLHDLTHLLAVIMVVFLLLFRIVVVSGSSMYNTLWHGDWLLVVSNVFCGDPEYGDIIVASKDSFNDGEPIIKRVIATEGQTVDIDFETGTVRVDGVVLQEDYIYSPTTDDEGMEFPLVVEENCVFVMGDNRGVSNDSRCPDIGQIDQREILGRAVFLLYPGTGTGIFQGERDFDRIGALK